MSNESVEFNGIAYRKYKKKSGYYYFRHGLSEYLHRAVWKYHFGEIPKGFHIHHKDCNSLNNSIENLECLSPKDHCKAHSILAKIDPSKDIYESRRRWHKSESGKIHHKEIWKIRKKIICNCQFCKKELLKHKCGSGKYTCKECRSKNRSKSASLYQKRKHVAKKRQVIRVSCVVCGEECDQQTKRKKEFCSKKCKAKSRHKSGVDNIVKNCLICNKDFTINKYSRTKTCGSSCRSEFIKISMKKG